ncbi:hypothetical protein GQ457_08G027850 [Hibiscus cannabinus]
MILNCILGQMSLKVTKNVISGPLVPIPNRRYRYPRYRYPNGGIDTLLLFFRKQIPVSNLSIDTQREYRYPSAGTDTLRLGTDTLEQRKGDESISELVEILSGEAKVVDVELG